MGRFFKLISMHKIFAYLVIAIAVKGSATRGNFPQNAKSSSIKITGAMSSGRALLHDFRFGIRYASETHFIDRSLAIAKNNGVKSRCVCLHKVLFLPY